MRLIRRAITAAAVASTACATGGSAWMDEPLVNEQPQWRTSAAPPSTPTSTPTSTPSASATAVASSPPTSIRAVGGTLVGVFRNTY